MKLKCYNKRCMESNNGNPYEWDYQGENPFYAPCPRCRGSVNIKKRRGGKK